MGKNESMIICELNIVGNFLHLYRGHCFVGTVMEEENNDSPMATLVSAENHLVKLTLNDMSIIQDNWNHLQEIQRNLKNNI